LEAEFAYIRDGSINDVAQQFRVPVPSHIHQLCFVWENIDPNLVSQDFSSAFFDSIKSISPLVLGEIFHTNKE